MKYQFLRSAVVMVLLVALFFSISNPVFAVSSSEIQKEIDRLEEEADKIAENRKEINQKIDENKAQSSNYVDQKLQIDQDIELARLEVENLNEQLHQYNLLIAEKQAELDELKQEQDALFLAYKQRMRAMQERGNISYWSVILSANSFADMLTDRAMIEEIAKADQRMMDKMRTMASEVLEAKESLAEEKLQMGGKKQELAQAQETLNEKRAEADAIIAELNADRDKLRDVLEEVEEQENKLLDDLAKLEQEYNKAKERETATFVSEKGFVFPVAYSGFQCVTSYYGYRTGTFSGFHNGTDFAAYQGTPVYASKTGVVTTAVNSYLYGNYVIINHGDGFSTYYGHMTQYLVSVGEKVTQGQVIGYVGSTGIYSTGPHLHFGVFYNGASVNPLDYVSVP